MEPLVKSLDEFLGERGLASPISDFMVDKIKVPRGLTLRKRKTLEKEAAEASQQYSKQRKAAVEEYNRLLSEGKIREPSNIERLLKVASGHEDNSATQAARRALEKRGVDWQTGIKKCGQQRPISCERTNMILKVNDTPEFNISMDININYDAEDISLTVHCWDKKNHLTQDTHFPASEFSQALAFYKQKEDEFVRGQAPDINNGKDKLPSMCYAVHNTEGSVIIVKNGETGYYNTSIGTKDAAESREIVDEYNAKLGVSKAQAAAMYAGSMFGFHVPAANPEMYDENGSPKRQSLDSRIKSAEEQKTDLGRNADNHKKDIIDLMK